jgi:hypothetical protein
MLERRTLKQYCFAYLLMVFLSALSHTAKAQPPASVDYQKNLERAIAALESLEEIDEAESPYYYRNQLDEMLTTVREALPEHQQVQGSEEVCTVDNSWLHSALKDLEAASPEQRQNKVPQILERLRAIEERVAYERRTAIDTDSKVYTKGKLESILARPEYAPQARGPNALQRLIQYFLQWLEKILPKPVRVQSGRARWVSVVAQIAVVIVALLVVFYVARILFRRFRRSPKKRAPRKRKARIVLGEQLKPEDTATDLLSEAEALARQGDLRAAIRKAYIALLVELGDRNLITLAQHKTNRDYLNAVRNIPLLHSKMHVLTDSFELHWYGFAEATENDWQNFRSRYRAALQTQN